MPSFADLIAMTKPIDGVSRCCRVCGIPKPLHELRKHPTSKFGRAQLCKDCDNTARQKTQEPRQLLTPEEKRAREKAYRDTRRDTYRAIIRAHYQNNKDAYRESRQRRRARERSANTELYSRTSIYERDNGTCIHCGIDVLYDEMHLDHLMPIAYEHIWSPCWGDVRLNVAVSCAPCNLSRGNREIAFEALRIVLEREIDLGNVVEDLDD
jgi:5-methylcytosine-specific restriction endonuclease McrA